MVKAPQYMRHRRLMTYRGIFLLLPHQTDVRPSECIQVCIKGSSKNFTTYSLSFWRQETALGNETVAYGSVEMGCNPPLYSAGLDYLCVKILCLPKFGI